MYSKAAAQTSLMSEADASIKGIIKRLSEKEVRNMKLNGSQILIECLLEQGVDTVFGYPGGAILNVYDELYKHRDKITHILTSHEQGASHAADGYARATGRVGVCISTSGPGATNLVTGIATAYMDSVPLIAITGNVGTNLLGRDSFQEVDIRGITMPITKHNFIVRSVEEMADTVRSAFRIAQEGRPGPVLIDLTKNATADVTEFKPQEPDKIEPFDSEIHAEDIDAAVRLIEKYHKPYILAGGGAVIANAQKELKEFAEKTDAPVADTLMGKGAFDGRDDRYTGMIGMHGTKVSNLGVSACDLLIVIGARFSDRVTGNAKRFAQKAKIIQIDVDAAEINKNVPVDLQIVGDARVVLERLNKKLSRQNHKEWMDHMMELKERFPLKYNHEALSGPGIIEEIYKETNGDAIVVTEVGQNQMWAAQYYKYKEPHQLLTSGGLGTMGYGLGASIGAKIGRPEKTVVNIAGDGCFRMNMNELATAARYHVPFVEVILNNSVLGMVRQWQTLFYGKRYSATVLEDQVDYVKVAEALGARGKRVTKKEDFAAAFREAAASDGPFVLDCVIDPDDKVFPMVPAGAAIADTFDEDDLKAKETK